MRVPIIMPQLGESIAEATIVHLAAAAGDLVTADQEIIEVETNKALLRVTSPCAGEVVEWLAQAQGTYEVGATLGYIEASDAEVQRLGLRPAPEPAPAAERKPAVGEDHSAPASNMPEMPTDVTPRHADAEPTVAGSGLPVPAVLAGSGYLSPRIRARLSELGLRAADLAGVAGSGSGGRVTIKDLERFLAELDTHPHSPAPAVRLAVADAMRRSWMRPLATVALPIVLDPLIVHRKASADKAAVTLYALRAMAIALGEDSLPGNRLMGKRIIPPTSIDLGFAVEVDGGLIVPVLRGADKIPLTDLNGKFTALVAAAKRRALPVEDSAGGIGTVTNFGAFGLTWATPIPLPDQTLMLGLGAGRKKPNWNDDAGAFLPVTEAELTLSFDHRVVDGRGAGRLLQRIAELLGEPSGL